MAPTHAADFSVLVSQHLAKPPFISLINKGPYIGIEWHTQTHTSLEMGDISWLWLSSHYRGDWVARNT